MAEARSPQFSVITSVYNMSAYIDAFFASLERQTYGIENLDIILTDDGSSDDSLAKCSEFAAKWPSAVRVFTKPNGGLSSARNFGLQHARGEWVSFADPDDVLSDTYFAEITQFLTDHGAVDLVSNSLEYLHDATQVVMNTHPLRHKFTLGNRVVDLSIESDCIQLQAASALMRLDAIRAQGLEFDERIRPTFEDAHFIGRYLLASTAPRVAIVSSARYLYRKRADGSSLVDTSGSVPAKYTSVPRFG